MTPEEAARQLIHAAMVGDAVAATAAIDAGADVNAKDADGDTALIYASLQGHTDIARALIVKGSNLDLQNDWGNTALMWASFKGRTEVAKALIAAGADITLQNDDGDTALIWASEYGHTEIVKLLQNAARRVRPSREEAGLLPPPSTKEQARTDRRWQEAEGIREKLRAGITDPGEVGF